MKQKLSSFICFLMIPLTVMIGYSYLQDKKYYFISFLLIIEALVAFFMLFENRKQKLSDMMMIAVMTAICTISRVAFYAIPEIKPMMAMVILSGIVFGKESGLMIGMLSAFISNMYFGQGPWTPWQMFATAFIGFLSGLVFYQKEVRRHSLMVSVWGFFVTLLLYGGLMNFYAVLSYTDTLTKEIVLSTYSLGLPFDLIHAASTFVFLILLTKGMIEKLERIRVKYGILEE